MSYRFGTDCNTLMKLTNYRLGKSGLKHGLMPNVFYNVF